MLSLPEAERLVTKLEAGEPACLTAKALNDVKRAVTGRSFPTPQEREAAQSLMFRLAFLRHTAREGLAPAGGAGSA